MRSGLPGAHRLSPEPRWGRWVGVAGSVGLTGITVAALLASGDGGSGAARADAQTLRGRPAGAQQPADQQPGDVRLGIAPVVGSAAALRAIARVVSATPDGAAGVSALDLTTGATTTVGSTDPMWTASMYKLLVLETLLRQGGPLSGDRLARATLMIEQSDNEAGYALFQDAGGNSALVETLRRLGVRDVVTDDVDPTFTRITPADGVALARALVRPGMLSVDSRAQALRLMRGVIPGQRWGVGVVADAGTTFANKNGWLSVDDSNGSSRSDDERWIVTTVGVVTVKGHQVLIAAMTEHNDTEQDGIDSVETMSQAAVALLGIDTTR